MGYRGEDLDLRTPQTWSATPSDLAGWSQGDPGAGAGRMRSGSYGIPRHAPIWVDETVLACCNHAFDVALAHRSGEVRVEHLLHALTRIDAAAEVLESRGVRVSGLRRESATIIASELPIGLTNGKGTPRRSDELEEVLRIAAAQAYRRNVPANVDDLLSVILEVKPDVQGAALLSRHLARPMRDMVEPPMQMPLARGSSYIAEQPVYVAPPVDPARTRMPSSSYYVEPPRPMRVEMPATQTDSIQNARLDALEQLVRGMMGEFGNEQKSMTGMLQGLHQQLQREIAGQRDETIRAGSRLNERLLSLEQSVADRRGGGIDLQPLQDRLDRLERTLSASQKVVEAQLAAPRAAEVDLTPISNRLDIIEEALLGQEGAQVQELNDRLTALERSISGELKGLSGALAAQISGAERVQASVQERIQSLTTALDRQTGQLSTSMVAPLMERLTGMSEGIERRQAEARQALVGLFERVNGLAAQVNGLGTGLEAHKGAFEGVNNAIRALQGTLGTLQSSVEGGTAQVLEIQKSYARELGEVHDALMKLNTNQHTLAGAIDQWRLDGQGDLAILGNRIDAVSKEVTKPLQMMETLASNMETMHRFTVERHHRRNRIWYWLFGTDDWVAASWPSQLSRIEEERRRVKSLSS